MGLWQFAMSRPMDVQQDFTVAAVLNLAMKFLLKPLAIIGGMTTVLSSVRSASFPESVLEYIPPGFFNFNMFTSLDSDDMAMQEQAFLGRDEDDLDDIAADFFFM